ncbi:rhomboid family intramembrane serine protease [Pelagibaculum spongiae]|uniref:Rhomboid family intramembrane serine protease n=1 Tax=Pelagibaculum spongiae TaxID=2080658 RepID=A0A2V1GQD4_9GAMM|nr:rhomboid family intramembrane serine protease [Pelagibaculum spongiae]PVZ63566.1 rhomboid family intramembrane serine protease [Pelagibaculum spongiae]
MRFRPLVILLSVIALTEATNLLSGRAFNGYGIEPRSIGGLFGIPLAPFLHGNLFHFLSNLFPLIILGALVCRLGNKVFSMVTAEIILLGGLAVWLFGRGDSIHIGASGLVFGWFGFLMARGWFAKNLIDPLVAVVVFIFYGGSMFWGLLPVASYISWESHLFGCIAGVLAAWGTSSGSQRST